MKPVSTITAIAGMSSVPRNDVSQGPRSGLRQNSGEKATGGRSGGTTVQPSQAPPGPARSHRARGLGRRQVAILMPCSFQSITGSAPAKASESSGPATVLLKGRRRSAEAILRHCPNEPNGRRIRIFFPRRRTICVEQPDAEAPNRRPGRSLRESGPSRDRPWRRTSHSSAVRDDHGERCPGRRRSDDEPGFLKKP